MFESSRCPLCKKRSQRAALRQALRVGIKLTAGGSERNTDFTPLAAALSATLRCGIERADGETGEREDQVVRPAGRDVKPVRPSGGVVRGVGPSGGEERGEGPSGGEGCGEGPSIHPRIRTNSLTPITTGTSSSTANTAATTPASVHSGTWSRTERFSGKSGRSSRASSPG